MVRIALGVLLALAPSEMFEPARLQSAAFAPVMPHAAGPGEVRLELTLDSGGAVATVRTLRDSPPWTDLLREAARSWVFAPATEDGQPVASGVLVAAIIRPPAMFLPAGPGEPPRDVGTATPALPVPIEAPTPPHPARTLGDGVVVLEVRVSAEGTVAAANVVQSAGGFDRPARETAMRWRFRPGRREGRAAPAVVVLVFGFREPVAPPSAPPPG